MPLRIRLIILANQPILDLLACLQKFSPLLNALFDKPRGGTDAAIGLFWDSK